MHAMKRMNNDVAVSPIVATLVLIVVAVIGAVAVGTIMGTFSSDVSKKASADQASSASSMEIIAAGSTTVDPVTQAIAKIYTAQNPGVKISSQATGSGAGFQAMSLGVADIGAMSEFPSTTQLSQTPNTVQYRIGSGAVAIITNHNQSALASGTTSVTAADLNTLYTGTPSSAWNTNAFGVSRSDSSGTADTFFKFITNGASKQSTVALNSNVVKKSGNAGVVQYVGSTDYAVGFGDFGYVYGRSDVDMLSINDGIYTYPGIKGSASSSAWDTQYSNLTTAAQAEYRNNIEKTKTGGQADAGATYNISLIHPLVYLTNGQPSNSVVKDYISFAESGAATQAFKDTHTFALSQVF